MMQRLRDRTQGLGFKILVGVLVFVLAIFGFGAFNLFSIGGTDIAEVNGIDISQDQFAKEVIREQRRLAAELGDSYTPDLIDENQLQLNTLELLISKTMLLEAARSAGFNINPNLIENRIRDNEAFHVDGRYNAESYKRLVRNLRYSPQEFLEESRNLAILAQLESGIADTSFVTDEELSYVAGLVNQTRDLAYLEFSAEQFDDGLTLSIDQLSEHYSDNAMLYISPESVDVSYVEIFVDDLRGEIEEIAEEEISNHIAALLDETVKSRRAKHLLLLAGETRSQKDAVDKLLEIRSEFLSGTDFEVLVERYSEDIGTSNQGGNLGLVTEGTLDSNLEQVLWDLEDMGVSEPIISEFGVHLIQALGSTAEERNDGLITRDSVRDVLITEKANELYKDRLRELDSIAFEEPLSLEPIASGFGMMIKKHLRVDSNTGGIFATKNVQEAVFSDEVFKEGFNSSVIEITNGHAVVLRADASHAAEVLPFDMVRSDIEQKLIGEESQRLAVESFNEAYARVLDGESVSVIAGDYEANWRVHPQAHRGDPDIPMEIRLEAFNLVAPKDREKSVGRGYVNGINPSVITVTRVLEGDIETMSETDIEALRQVLGNRSTSIDFGSYYKTIQQGAKIDRRL